MYVNEPIVAPPFPFFLVKVTEVTVDYTNCTPAGSTTTCADLIGNPSTIATVPTCTCTVDVTVPKDIDGQVCAVVWLPNHRWYAQCRAGKIVRLVAVIDNRPHAHQVYLYYKLERFFQNHRRYVKSRDDSQLHGRDTTVASNCDPLDVDAAGNTYAPCGYIANSMFNGMRCLQTLTPSDFKTGFLVSHFHYCTLVRKYPHEDPTWHRQSHSMEVL